MHKTTNVLLVEVLEFLVIKTETVQKCLMN